MTQGNFFSDLLAVVAQGESIRRSDGSGIGNVAGSAVHLRIDLDVGSTWYALAAGPENVQSAFESAFADFELRKKLTMHSMAAGTTIDLVITGLSAGAGIVAIEFLKGAGKDLWKALRSLLPEKKSESSSATESESSSARSGDTIALTLEIDGKKVKTRITLPSPRKEISTEELLRRFCLDRAAELYLQEIEQRKREAPHSARLEACKEANKEDD
jgi:hypothetical protein